jgi:virginiamycin B lyase
MKVLPSFAIATILLAAAPGLAAQAVELREWPVPYADSRPRDPYVDGQGRVWFVGQVGNYVAYLEPSSGEFRRYELEERALPHNLVVADDGAVWYAGNGNGHIGRLDPATGQVRRFAMPDSAARDPHTLVFDRGGDLWFTVQGGNFVGRLDAGTGEVRLIPSATARSRPYGIVIDGQDRVWLNLFGTNKLAVIDPATMRMEEIALPRADARTRRIALTRDGAVWYVDYAGGMLGRYDPAARQFREWPLPGGTGSRPYAMAVDDQDRVWMVETGARPNRFVGFDPRTGEFFSNTPIESGGGAVRHMVFHAPTREIWFGTDTNTIGRAKVP